MKLVDEFDVGAKKCHVGHAFVDRLACAGPHSCAFDVDADEVAVGIFLGEPDGIFALAAAEFGDDVGVPGAEELVCAEVGIFVHVAAVLGVDKFPALGGGIDAELPSLCLVGTGVFSAEGGVAARAARVGVGEETALRVHNGVWVVGRCYVVERTVLVSFLHPEVQYVKSIVHLKVLAHVFHVESVEARLCLTQGRFHLASLQHLVRMLRTDTKRLSSVDDIFSQSESEACNTLVSFFVAYRIVVDGAQHTAEVRIVSVAVLFSHDLL